MRNIPVSPPRVHSGKHLPAPPRYVRRTSPMAVKDARRIVDAYNRWVRVWNREELSRVGKPTNPRSEKGDVFWHDRHRSSLGWDDYETGRRCLIRVEGFRGHDHRTGLRRQVDWDKIVWGAWVP